MNKNIPMIAGVIVGGAVLYWFINRNTAEASGEVTGSHETRLTSLTDNQLNMRRALASQAPRNNMRVFTG